MRTRATLQTLLDLLSRRAADLSGPELRQARHLAGLSIGQACRLLHVPGPALLVIEEGRARPDAELAARLDEIYGLGHAEGHCPPPAWKQEHSQ